MALEHHEPVQQIPEQAFTLSAGVKSISLGQGTCEFIPTPPLGLFEVLDRLGNTPNDKWMWLALPEVPEADMPMLIDKLSAQPSPALLHALALHGHGDSPEISEAIDRLGRDGLISLIEGIPLVDSRAIYMNPTRREIETVWDQIRGFSREQLVPVSQMTGLRMPIPQDFLPGERVEPMVSLEAVREIYDTRVTHGEEQTSLATGTSMRDAQLQDTIDRINENSVLQAVIQGKTMIGRRFCGTYALPIPWQANWRVNLDRAHYRVTGQTGCSGKGLTHEATTASGFMELAERVSAIPGATPDWPRGYTSFECLRRASYSQLQSEGVSVLNPNDFSLLVPYTDQEIYWIPAHYLPALDQGEVNQILVPAQKAFHMINLDEPQVLRDTSNGLASGNTQEEARLHALLEIIERDGCYTTFTTERRLFVLPTDTADELGQIIAAYESKGLHPAFIDLTTDFGVPAYKAYLQLPNGQILSGSGAHLNGRIALNRAICELGAKCLGLMGHITLASKDQKVTERTYSDIPNFSTGAVGADLILLETLLQLNGYPVIYADLTRRDVGIPVVRAIVPGLDSPFSLTKREVKHFMEDSGLA